MDIESRSIEKSKISESALSLFKFFFWSKILDLEEADRTITTFSVQAKIKVLRGRARRFIDSRPYSFFKFVILPENGIDVLNAEVSLEIKNFDYWIKELAPKRYVIVIGHTWDDFIVYEETIDKNLIPFIL